MHTSLVLRIENKSTSPTAIPCAGGLHAVDLSTPSEPRFAGCFDEAGYIHDGQCVIYHGPDKRYIGRELCFCANAPSGVRGDMGHGGQLGVDTASMGASCGGSQQCGGGLLIVDVTDKGRFSAVGSATYPFATFPHQGWLTPDHRLFLFGDEQDEIPGLGQGGPRNSSRAIIFDVLDLEAPIFVRRDEDNSRHSTDHNLFVLSPPGPTGGNVVLQAAYADGLRVYTLGAPGAPLPAVGKAGPAEAADGAVPAWAVLKDVGFFDTEPAVSGPGMNVGAWGVVPVGSRGPRVLVTDQARGLFVLRVRALEAPLQEPHPFAALSDMNVNWSLAVAVPLLLLAAAALRWLCPPSRNYEVLDEQRAAACEPRILGKLSEGVAL